MRLTISQNDYLRASFIARKISTRFFENDADEVPFYFILFDFYGKLFFQVQELKLEYYKYMIQIGLFNEDYLDVCKHYRAVFETSKVKNDNLKANEVIIFYNLIIFV